MNHLAKATVFGTPATLHLSLRAVCFFHSTPVSERRRKTHWNSEFGTFRVKRFNNYAKRQRKLESKRTLLRNISEYAEQLFQGWRAEDDHSSANEHTSWFRRQYWSRGTTKDGPSSVRWGSSQNKRRGGIEFCMSDDDEVETVFRATFGGERYYYWHFNNSEHFHQQSSSKHANSRYSWDWRYQTDFESDTDDDGNRSSLQELASERLALGLSPSGPLKIEEVKKAYRACALRWHPDRHQGSSKIAAEEKFKNCSTAYKLICDKLGASQLRTQKATH